MRIAGASQTVLNAMRIYVRSAMDALRQADPSLTLFYTLP